MRGVSGSMVLGAGPIGLDIGSRMIRAVQMDASGATVHACVTLPRAAGANAELREDEAVRLSGVLRRRGFAGGRVITAVPSSRLLSAVLDLPPRSSGAPLTEIARGEIARLNKVDPGALELAMWDLPQGPRSRPGDPQPAMVVACTTADAEATLAPLDAAGLETVGLDAPAAALARGVTGNSGARWSGLLDLGASAATFMIFGGGQPLFERRVADAGLTRMHAELAGSVGSDAEAASRLLSMLGGEGGDEALSDARDAARRVIRGFASTVVAELRTTLAYVAHRDPEVALERVMLTGGGSGLPGLPEELSRQAGVTLTPLSWSDLAASSRVNTGLMAPAPLALAIGLARNWRASAKEAA